MSKPYYKNIEELLMVARDEATPHELDPELYDEDEDLLDYLSYDYINRFGTEFGERVLYWESDYGPSAYRLGEFDAPDAGEIFDTLEDYGLEFDTDLVAKFPKDYQDTNIK